MNVWFFLLSIQVLFGGSMEKEFREKKKRKDSIKAGEIIKEHGLSVFMAAVFLAGELAGSGALKLPAALVGTGKISSIFNGQAM